jgi:type I restriction enzyme S subunit
MELKPGYKWTEVGTVPEHWEVGNLEKYWSITDCKHVTAKFVDSGIPVASIREVQSKYVELRDAKQTTEVYYKQLIEGGREPSPGDLIFSRNATVGEVAQVSDSHPPFAMGQDVCILKRRSVNNSTDYMQAVIKSNIVVAQLENMMVGSTFRRVNVEQIRSLKVPIPPLPEQSAIATALSDVDALIRSLDQLIAKKRDLKQAAMQQLLTGKTRLPGFEGEWEVKTFGEIFAYFSTATNSRADLSLDAGDCYYIHYGDIHTKFHGHLDFNEVRPQMIARKKCGNATSLRNGDWVMADASEDFDGVGKSIEIQGLLDGMDAIAGLHTVLLREKSPTFAPGFKGHLGGLNSLHQQYLRVATGMKVFGVSKAALKALVLPVPPIAEQAAIATVLSDMDAEITALEARLAKTKALKQGMMQELLTGRTRLV